MLGNLVIPYRIINERKYNDSGANFQAFVLRHDAAPQSNKRSIIMDEHESQGWRGMTAEKLLIGQGAAGCRLED